LWWLVLVVVVVVVAEKGCLSATTCPFDSINSREKGCGGGCVMDLDGGGGLREKRNFNDLLFYKSAPKRMLLIEIKKMLVWRCRDRRSRGCEAGIVFSKTKTLTFVLSFSLTSTHRLPIEMKEKKKKKK
jgi:hypothetical protein